MQDLKFWRKKKTRSSVTIPVAIGNVETVGYTRLSDNPDVLIAVDKIADLVSNMTIHLMENTDEGDKRLKNGLSRKIDVEPHKNMTRKTWIYKIVSDLLLYGDGNSVVHIGVNPGTGLIDNLTPFQMQAVSYEDVDGDYLINFNGIRYKPEEVIHFVINPHPNYPYRGTGYRVALKEIIRNLNQATKTKNNFMSGKYMPSLIISVDAMTEELSSKEGRENIMAKYFDETEGGKPWIIPANLINVEQVKPLSLKDIAINEGVELDKKTVAGLFGIPAFFLGIGEFNKDEYNNFVNTRIFSIGQIIAQTLTRDLLFHPNWFFRLNPRSLYSYDLSEMVEAGTKMVDRNAMRRNELRDWVGLDPDKEMQELIILENYIPANKIGNQNKLKGGGTDGE
ncbi:MULTISPECIES: phage portal protein [Bacillus]|uniref:phage portal protein n=1 Tax=Bacillus TaxID=1386 RepID=UPI0022DF4D3F|nr:MULTISPECIES: phage portal protein [Bacillus]MDA1690241.1 phage portal protein [Bacillus cereus group sp. TH147LC]MDK7546460.1 phage portal protein [Bacillus pacificus]MDK7550522.1 phage portal protein [Bacillus pacificus]MDK7566068.1 phage portal protein [Bacillus pacificus]MDK7579277.1 phage portal protein [Bacillus pacificus]